MKKACWKFLAVLGIFCGVFLFGVWRLVSVLIYRPAIIKSEGPLDDEYKPFEAVNPRGEKIAAWYAAGNPGNSIILLCHGHSAEHTWFEFLADFFLREGYSVLLLDFRAHGQSGGDFTSIGMHEWEDIHAVFSEGEKKRIFSLAQPIAAYGCSMGAAALVNGAKHLPEIKAFIIESCFSELRKIAGHDLLHFTSIPDNPLVDLFFYIGSWRSGYAYFKNQPIREIAQIATRPLLLIHDGRDKRVLREDFDRMVQAAGPAKTLIFQEAGHTQAQFHDPERFQSEVCSFLISAGIRP